jgi:hypothetical protein
VAGFDKPCAVVKRAVDYCREHMALGNYLTKKIETEMTLVGERTAMLGLKGVCQLPHFEPLCQGLEPVSAEKLMLREKGTQRRVCFFGQVSRQGCVCSMWSVATHWHIEARWRESVADIWQGFVNSARSPVITCEPAREYASLGEYCLRKASHCRINYRLGK